MIDPKEEIRKILKAHDENCDVQAEENMLKFGAEAYNLALENICRVAPISEIQKAVIRSMRIGEGEAK